MYRDEDDPAIHAIPFGIIQTALVVDLFVLRNRGFWLNSFIRQMEKMVDNTGAKSISSGTDVSVGDASVPKSEVSLGKRLESLGKEEVVDIMSEMNSSENSSKLPQIGSLEVLLSQYLEANDYTQIDNILNVNDRKVYFLISFKLVDRKSDY